MHVITHACSPTEGLTLPPTEMLSLRGEGWREKRSGWESSEEGGLPQKLADTAWPASTALLCPLRASRMLHQRRQREVGALTQKRGERKTEAGVLVLPSQCWLEALASPYLCKIRGMRLTAWGEHTLNKQTPGRHQDTRPHSLYLPRRGCVLTERRCTDPELCRHCEIPR